MALRFLINTALPCLYWTLVILRGVFEDVFLYQGRSTGTICNAAGVSAWVMRVNYAQTGPYMVSILALYLVWYVSWTASIATSDSGYDIDGIPESEWHRWTSPVGLNGLNTVLIFVTMVPALLILGAVLDANAAAVVIQAHSKVKQMRATQISMAKDRYLLHRVVLMQVPLFARQCMT